MPFDVPTRSESGRNAEASCARFRAPVERSALTAERVVRPLWAGHRQLPLKCQVAVDLTVRRRSICRQICDDESLAS